MLPVQERVLANGERWISEGYSNEYGYETAMFEMPVLDEELQIGRSARVRDAEVLYG